MLRIQSIYYMSVEDITSGHAPEPGTEADSDYYDSDGEPCPGWYFDLGSPGCLPDSTLGPYDNPRDGWMEVTDSGMLVHPTFEAGQDGQRTRHALIVPDMDENRIPYFVEIDATTNIGIGILHDWGHSFIKADRYHSGWKVEDAPMINESAFINIARHGCAGGQWMPAVTYVQARQILQYADRLDDYFNDSDIEFENVIGDETSLDSLACRVASLLCESVAKAIDLEADTMRHMMEDRA